MQAAELTTLQAGGEALCALDLGGEYQVEFTAPQGAGITGPIILHLYGSRIANAAMDKQLRLEIMPSESARPAHFVGALNDMDGDAFFQVPMSLMEELARVKLFSLRYEDQSTATVASFSQSELESFMSCMTGH
jgi:hypothetical protein